MIKSTLSILILSTFTLLVAAKYHPNFRFMTDTVEYWLTSDLWLHALGGFLLPLATYRILNIRRLALSGRALFLLVILALFTLDELLQTLVAHRHASWLDWQVTFLGWLISVAWLLGSSWWIVKHDL